MQKSQLYNPQYSNKTVKSSNLIISTSIDPSENFHTGFFEGNFPSNNFGHNDFSRICRNFRAIGPKRCERPWFEFDDRSLRFISATIGSTAKPCVDFSVRNFPGNNFYRMEFCRNCRNLWVTSRKVVDWIFPPFYLRNYQFYDETLHGVFCRKFPEENFWFRDFLTYLS